MTKNSISFYSKEKLNSLRNQGVIIPDMNSVLIGNEIPHENISPGSILYPFVRIHGEKTTIHQGSQIGKYGSTTLQDSWIGENVIVGNLGPVTLKNVVVGPENILGSGVAENSVFLGKDSNVNKFTTGYGFSIRKGTLFEEDSSSAQHTDTKMTILFPWSTLGSNINFCDVILTGGKGAEIGLFSEVGSGTIHFNYTIRGDKATASIFGDVSRGVFLDKEPIFIGGNNSLIGPIESDFGVKTAAETRITGSLSPGLNFGKPLPRGKVSYDPKTFVGVMEVITRQVNVLAELVALKNWYKQIRISCIAKTSEMEFIYSSGLKIVELNFIERLFQISEFLDSVQNFQSFHERSKKIPKNEILEQRELIKKWPSIEKRLADLKDFEISAPKELTNSIIEQQSSGLSKYTKTIQNISKESKKLGEEWLFNISNNVRNVLYS